MNSWYQVLFFISLVLFLILSLFEIYKLATTHGKATDETALLEKRKKEFYKELDKSGIEPHPARYWEVYIEGEESDDD